MVVANAIRISENVLGAAEIGELAARHLGNARVAQELAAVLGNSSSEAASRMLAGILLLHRAEPYVSAIAFSSVKPDNIEAITRTLGLAYTDVTKFKNELKEFGDITTPSNAQIEKLAMMASQWNVDFAVATLIDSIVSGDGEEVKFWQVSILIGLLERGATLEGLTEDPEQRDVLKRIIEGARKIAANDAAPEWQRLETVRLLQCRAAFDPDRDIDLLVSWISPGATSKKRAAAFRTLGKTGHARAAERLIHQWNSLSPGDRRSTMQLLLGRGSWTEKLLAALESKSIPASQIDAATRQRLMDSSNKDLQKRSHDLFTGASNSTRAEVLKNHADVLTIKSDPAAGKAIFATACIVCHVAEGLGNAIGPDLAALTDRSPDSMLVAILDPNRAVEDKYVNYSITAKDGTQYLGLISEESATSISLRAADGSEQKILRKDIEGMISTGISLMPEGLEATLTKQQLADLIAYIGGLGSSSGPRVPPLSARVRPNGKGVIELRASKCKITGDRIEYMEDFDALGWWTSEKDRAEWTVVMDRPGSYRVEWEYSVSPKAAGNQWLLVVDGKPALEGKVESTGSWEIFKTASIGEVTLSAADNKIVVRSKGKVNQALFDLRAIRFLPIEKK